MRGRESKLFTLPRSSLSLALSSLITSSGSVFTRAMTLGTSSGTYPSQKFALRMHVHSVSWSSDLFQHADQCELTWGGGRVLWHPQCVFPKHIRRQISNEELQESKRRPSGMSWFVTLNKAHGTYFSGGCWYSGSWANWAPTSGRFPPWMRCGKISQTDYSCVTLVLS